MRELRPLLALALLACVLHSGGAGASVFEYNAELRLTLGKFSPVVATSTGLATVNGSASSSLVITKLSFDSEIAASSVIPITDPAVTAAGLTAIELSMSKLAGTLAFSPPVPSAPTGQVNDSELPLFGALRLCLIGGGCPSASIDLTFPQTMNGSSVGVGVGGILTGGPSGGFQISLLGAPWTLAQVSASNGRTGNGAISMVVTRGFTSLGTTNASLQLGDGPPPGRLQLVTASQVTITGIPGNNDKMALLGALEIVLVPEPGAFLLLTSGALAVAALGRRRARSSR